jgi:hypothetical protein
MLIRDAKNATADVLPTPNPSQEGRVDSLEEGIENIIENQPWRERWQSRHLTNLLLGGTGGELIFTMLQKWDVPDLLFIQEIGSFWERQGLRYLVNIRQIAHNPLDWTRPDLD